MQRVVFTHSQQSPGGNHNRFPPSEPWLGLEGSRGQRGPLGLLSPHISLPAGPEVPTPNPFSSQSKAPDPDLHPGRGQPEHLSLLWTPGDSQ